ncbi:MAG TPA: 23S rRNA (pseudouridine(1915)-N(3))-methyltransferase RlmH [Gemmatimonadales bacterium]|nr:23S rRNA (pseudouridine(1915)-N(3))-methyltransferase RlmH [Gemmatimonadales bacterium]
MDLTLYAVGKLRPMYRTVADEYLARLGHYCRVEEIEVREAGKAPSAEVMMRQESERLAERIRDDSHVVLLDREARAWSSEQLSGRLDGWRNIGKPVALVVGGSHGVTTEFTRGAAERWSLGPMTLPHELARVVVLEQCYRAWTILRGEKYHK